MRLEADTLRLPGLRHGFFGRQGGVSGGAYASLNVGLRGGDDLGLVLRNRALIAQSLGAEPDRLVTARQVHGTACIEVTEPWPLMTAPEADALVTRRRDVLLGVLSADCVPALLADPEAGVVGAVHAGWKGALAGALESAVAAMVALGAERANIRAAIGPCIGRRSYEVGPEFQDRFLAEDGGSEPFFRLNATSGRPHFDIEGYAALRLTRAGVGRIEAMGQDTCADEARWFSYRRATLRGETAFGLQVAVIGLAG